MVETYWSLVALSLVAAFAIGFVVAYSMWTRHINMAFDEKERQYRDYEDEV